MDQLRKRFIFIIWMILSLFLLMGFTDKDLPVDKEDQKKLEKAQKLNYEAQGLNDKANSLYSEIAEYETLDSEDIKKIEKLKEKALDNQLSALELQKEANFLEYNVYKKVIPELKSQFSVQNSIPLEAKLLEEQANELFYKAEMLRNETYNLDKSEKEGRFAKLSEAQEFEKEGINKQKQVIDIYSGKTSVISKTQEVPGSVLDGDVEVNKSLLQAYMDYLNHGDSLSAFDSFRELIYSDSLSSSSLRSTWDNYLYTEKPVLASEESIVEDTTIEEISRDIAMQYDDSKEVTTKTYDWSEDVIDDDIIYKVQIAADKKPLSQNTLRRIYNGNKEIEMISEEGWNKYSIGDFNTFSEADNYKNTLGVSDAFVVAYRNGVKVDLLALKSESKKYKTTSSLSVDLIFKVQIAADRIGLSEKMLNNIYKGNEVIDMIEEDDWYKYSIGKSGTYEQAVNLKELTKVDGAFIVAYKDGIKVPLYLAIKGKVPIASTSENNIVFKVQVAADTKALSSEKLHRIYSGFEKTNRFNEDGWYKYSIGEFKTFNEANELRKSCGVKGAFIIAFQGGKKVNILAAKNMVRCCDPKIISDWPSNNDQVVFRVQIAASNKKMSINQIKNIYCKEPNVYLIEEDGWFKYSVGSFKKYQIALQMKENSGVTGAFIVAYKNGKKLNIKEAINLSNK